MLFPDGAYAKRGDAIVRKEIDEDVAGHNFDLQPVARVHDITDEGEVYCFSSENENLRVTEDMASEVIELLGPDEHYMLFTVVGKADKVPLALVTEEEGASDHSIEGKNVVYGVQVGASAFRGFDQHMWEKGREYLVFARYELHSCQNKKQNWGQCSSLRRGASLLTALSVMWLTTSK